MAAIINTNLQSLNAQRNLSTSQSSLATSMQRLSSGLRINSAKDDAAGLAISDRMTTQVRGLTVAARNANDGISLAQTAEGALSSVTNNLQRIRELAIQARNATNSAEDRAALDAEVQQLKAEITRVAQQTGFNGTKLLDGSFTNMAFQVGANQGETIDIKEVVNANLNALGNWQSVSVSSKLTGGELTGANSAVTVPGVLDLKPNGVSETAYPAFTATVNGATYGIAAASGTDANDKIVKLAAALNSALSGAQSISAAEVNGQLQFVSANAGPITMNLGFDSPFGAKTVNTPAQRVVENGALPAVDLKVNNVAIKLNAAGSVADRLKDMVNVINGTNFGSNPKVTASIVNGAVALSSAAGDVTLATGTANAAEVFAGTGLTMGSTTAGGIVGSRPFEPAVQKTGFEDLNVLDADFADNAIKAMDAALTQVNDARAKLGAVQKRFETTIENLNITNENVTASRSRILDADFAAETAALSRAQILQQAGTAMVAQANQVPQQVLQLLQG